MTGDEFVDLRFISFDRIYLFLRNILRDRSPIKEARGDGLVQAGMSVSEIARVSKFLQQIDCRYETEVAKHHEAILAAGRKRTEAEVELAKSLKLSFPEVNFSLDKSGKLE